MLTCLWMLLRKKDGIWAQLGFHEGVLCSKTLESGAS
jgi:hypothetical protein